VLIEFYECHSLISFCFLFFVSTLLPNQMEYHAAKKEILPAFNLNVMP